MPRRAAVLAVLLLLAVPGVAPAATTGRLLVTLDAEPSRTVFSRAAAALPGVRRDSVQIPQIGVVSVRPPAGAGIALTAQALRRLPGVVRVEVERRATLRYTANDPALTVPETAAGTAAGTPLQWWAQRSNLPAAWDVARGAGATVGVIDTGVDGGHPDLNGRIAAAVDLDGDPRHGSATTDENGHGTHVSSIACAGADNGVGIAGAGFDCRLVVLKSDLSDGSVAAAIVQAADRGVGALNMSFGTDGSLPPVQAIVDAVDYAYRKGVVLVASAADEPVEQQGDPANLLQPTGTGPDINAGKGLSVTAATFAGERAPFAGRGTQISLAAFGSYAPQGGPAGLFAAFPGNETELERGGGLIFPQPACNCRTTFAGDSRYAYLEGTSMAAPIVAATAAMARAVNPEATAADIIRILKFTATRTGNRGWTPDLGWGVLDAGAAIAAVRAIDRHAPASELTGKRRIRSARTMTLRWSGRDAAPNEALQASGIHVYEVWRSANRRPYRRIARTAATRLKVKVRPGSRYRFYTRAVDNAGNREAVPARPDLVTRVDARRR